MANKPIREIEGIGPAFAEGLLKAGITHTDQLLAEGGSKKGRVALAAASGLDESKILKWVNMADLFRINGVAGQNAELLKAAGVDTVKELKMRRADNLHEKMKAVNAEKKLTRVVAGPETIQNWIDQAKTLEPAVSH